MDTGAFDKFRKEDCDSILTYEEGDFLATCFVAFGRWSWVVWHKGHALDGFQSFHTTAADACEAALKAVGERIKRRRYW